MAKQNLTAELFYSGSWHTVPAYVRNPVSISRERPTGSEPTPFTGSVTLQGIHNPKNPFSTLYGLAGQNTPIRFKLSSDTRFYGEVASWEPGRSIKYDAATGKGDAWTDVTATGILRRLGQGADPLRSAHTRAIIDSTTAPLAHWPLEDPERSTVGASTVAGVAPMRPRTEVRSTLPSGADIPPGGVPVFASGLGPAGSSRLASIENGGSLVGRIPASATTTWTIEWVMTLPVGQTSGAVMAAWEAPGTYTHFIAESLADGKVGVVHYTDAGWASASASGTAYTTRSYFDGIGHHYAYTVAQNGGNYRARLYVDGTLAATSDNFGAAMAGTVGGTPTVAELNPFDTITGDGATAIGQIVVWASEGAPIDTVTPAFGHVGEMAHERIVRLCAQEGIPVTIEGATSQLMGPQPLETLMAIFAEVERTDDGLLFEPRGSYGLVYRCGRERYNRPVALALDFAAYEVAPPLVPVLDDLASRNDVTVKRRDGGSARAVLETGPLSVQEPPDGIGRYTTSVDVNTYTDDVLPHHAYWHLSKGTIDGVRYARVTVDLDASPGLATDAAAVDIGDVITIDNLPEDEHPGLARLTVLGYTETIGSHRRIITYLCIPAATFDVGVYGPNAAQSRYDSATSALIVTVDDNDTAWKMVEASGTGWVTTATHPTRFAAGGADMRIDVGGLTYSCTAISATTPTFIAAGTAAHGNNASVSPGMPAGVQTGDLVLILAAIRNSGVGHPIPPTGYTTLFDQGNFQLFGRYYASGDVAPTINFAGGVANASTSAQMAAFRGAGITVHSQASVLNGSGQDITFPPLGITRAGCLALALGWKQDDWTSVAQSAGWTEIGEPSTTTGDDQGMSWAYVVAGSDVTALMTVTGGAAAISRGAIVALEGGSYDLTVTRLATDKSHAVGAGIRVHDAGRYGL